MVTIENFEQGAGAIAASFPTIVIFRQLKLHELFIVSKDTGHK
jgi:hypothetical protein